MVTATALPMKKKEGRLRDWTAIGVVVAVIGIAAPIAWDWYKNTNALSLEELASTTIADPKLMPEHLALSYDGNAVTNLTKLTFQLINSGHTPIQTAQVVEAPRIEFAPPAKILAFQITKVVPSGIRMAWKLDPNN
jgi:hypothetical protein